jgi:hypothetical protein
LDIKNQHVENEKLGERMNVCHCNQARSADFVPICANEEQFEFCSCAQLADGEVKVFLHHIYEYKKGVRNLILHTVSSYYENFVRSQLEKKSISYIIRYMNNGRLNVFFGNPKCIEVLNEIGDKNLNEFSDEEDFMLGTMLGYGLNEQCKRFLRRKSKTEVGNLVG